MSPTTGSFPRQGEIWEIQLEPTVGHEQGGTRPAVVLSVDGINAARWVSIIIPMTRQIRRMPTRILVDVEETGLPEPSDIICDQIRAVDHARLLYRRGSVSPQTLRRCSELIQRMIRP